jgi:hypothetical protein
MPSKSLRAHCLSSLCLSSLCLLHITTTSCDSQYPDCDAYPLPASELTYQIEITKKIDALTHQPCSADWTADRPSPPLIASGTLHVLIQDQETSRISNFDLVTKAIPEWNERACFNSAPGGEARLWGVALTLNRPSRINTSPEADIFVADTPYICTSFFCDPPGTHDRFSTPCDTTFYAECATQNSSAPPLCLKIQDITHRPSP